MKHFNYKKEPDNSMNAAPKLNLQLLFDQIKVLWNRKVPNIEIASYVELALGAAVFIGIAISVTWYAVGEPVVALNTAIYMLANFVGYWLVRTRRISTVSASRILVISIFAIVFSHALLIWDKTFASIGWILVGISASLLFLTLKESFFYYVVGCILIASRVILFGQDHYVGIEVTEWLFVTTLVFLGILTLIAISVHYFDETKAQMERVSASDEASRKAKRARDQFFSEVSHDLLTPLNAIYGISNIMVEQQNPEVTEALKKRLRASSKQLLCLVRDLLDHTKLESNTLSLMQQPFDIKRVFNEAYEVCEVLAVANNVDLSMTLDKDLPQNVVGDEQRLLQIIFNLVNNAIKFSPDGAVTIRVRHENINDNEITLFFDVIDDGIGIEPENHQLIFETYTQANTEIAGRFGGTGLGLSITRSLVQRMGGTISLKSALGEGSTFSVCIEFERAKCFVEREREQFKSDKPIAILIVDDSDINRKLAKAQVLERFPNARIGEAYDGLNAVQQFSNDSVHYDVVIMDIKMPRMNGIEATKSILALPNVNPKPVIYGLSADNNSKQIKTCFNVGMRDYVLKPCDYDLLAEHINEDTNALHLAGH